MKQNVFGVVLFSIIIGTAIIVSEFFVTLPTPPAVYEKPIYEGKTSCRKVVYNSPSTQVAKVQVNQAILNSKTKQLNTSLTVERSDFSTETVGLTYHFFVKDGKTTRFLASETVGIKPDFNTGNKVNHEVLSSYSWLDNLDSQSNLYLLAESGNPFSPELKSIPRFDEFNATPILLMKGKK